MILHAHRIVQCFLLVALILASAPAAASQFLAYYTTREGAELVDTLPVKRVANQGWTVIYEITVLHVQPGDIFTITGKAQATNNLHKPPFNSPNSNVALGSSLAYIGAQGEFRPITYWTGENIDARIHHGVRLESTVWQAPAGVPENLRIRFYLKSAAQQAKARWELRVDRGYGYLRITHERPDG